MQTLTFNLPLVELFWICVSLFLLTLITAFYYIMIQPKQHEKIESRRPTKKEIDYRFDKNDPFSETELQGLGNN